MNFCINLKKLRKGKRISQTAIAELLDVSQRTISHYENGTCQPSIEGLCKLADIMEVSLDELVGRTLVKKQPSDY
ncbi:MAG: helix-turn-helix domain-containing protein [Clostridia bacterium]|nr:helix-turn-helix domain-containing protein [Clostridia bacterium]